MLGSSFEEGIKKKKTQRQEKVEEESTYTVIKAEMNDEFRVCGVERPDDRTTEGPPPILKVFLAATPPPPPPPRQLAPAFTLRFPQTRKYEANLQAYAS